jgi:arylsulfatase A-like enzyme
MNFRLLPPLLTLVAMATGGFAQSPAPVSKPERPLPAVEHVIVISIDGLRPDRALLAEMPTLRAMLRSGAYTFWARTTPGSVTLPSHTSMLTGVIPGKHGIEWNRDLPFSEPVYSKVPTVMELATKAGYVTAMVAGKSKFSALNKPGTISHVFVPVGEKGDNDQVVLEASKVIEAHKPHFLFVHFPDVDTVGHAEGWGSAGQLAQIEKTDAQLGQLFTALDRAGIRESTVVILSADHGGAGRTHGAEDPRSRHIPWIVTGPAVRKFFDLTQIATLEVRTEDTCATACWLLGLPLAVNFDGKPVYEAFLRQN